MKRLLTIAALVMWLPSLAAGQGGAIGVFDEPLLMCGISDLAPGLVDVYVIHFAMEGATASRFRVTQGVGANLTYLGDASDFGLTQGNVQTGLTVCYPDCLEAPVVVTRVLYFGHGLSATCSTIQVAPHPVSLAGVEAVDCEGNTVTAAGWVNWVNMVPVACNCFDPPPPTAAQKPDAQANGFPLCEVVPTEESSWGRIKQLYRLE